MGIRETINKLDPRIVIVAIGLILLMLGYGLYNSFSAPGDPTAGTPVTLQCVNTACRNTQTLPMAHVLSRATIFDEFPNAPGVTCDACKQNTLAYAHTCPRDQTVFTNSYEGETAHAKCPAPDCGWDALEAQRQKLAEMVQRR